MRPVEPNDASILAFLRIGVGAVLSWEMWRYLDLGYPDSHYNVQIHFTYWPLDWLRPLPPAGMTVLFVAMSLAAALLALGVYWRIAGSLLCAGMVYVLLLDRAYYLNHWYLAAVLVFLLLLTPAGGMFSIDKRAGWAEPRAEIPSWTVWIFRFQIGVVYFYAGLSKVNSDWLTGKPLGIWLGREQSFPVIGQWFDSEATAVAMAILATVFDLAIIPLMLVPRIRRYVYPVALGFHLMNSRIFDIGMFPWVMVLVTVVYFPADLPRRFVADLRQGTRRLPTLAGSVVMASGYFVVSETISYPALIACLIGGAIAGYTLGGGDDGRTRVSRPSLPAAPKVLRVVVVAWIVLQLALPLRPYIYPGNTAWTEEGQQFSWRLLLRTKGGEVTFAVRDPQTGAETFFDPDRYLSIGQQNNLPEQPDMLVQFAHWLEGQLRPRYGGRDLEVRAITSVTLNGRPGIPLVDPEADLTKVSRPWMPPAPWIEDPPPGT